MAGRYKTYPEYKSSSASWCGQVPTHWSEVKFKWVFEKKSKISNPLLPAGSISFGEVVYKSEDSLSSETKASYQEVLTDELLVNPLNLNFDLKSLRTALSKIDVVVSTGYIVVYISKTLNKNYIRWVMHLFDISHMKTLGAGVRQTINFNDIANSFVCIAPEEEQQTIANFLDHETAKIDTLITKQEKLIELLKEKRQAVISHAVTKGLNPDVLMKDSGVEWLGEVPEHWKISKIRFDFEFDKGLTITKANLVDKGIPCVNYGEIHSKFGFEVDPNVHKLKYVNDGYLKSNKKSLLNHGDIVFADTSEDLEGAGNFTQLTSDEKVFAGYHTIITRCVKDSHSRFIAYLFDSVAFRKQIQYAVKGVKVFSITQAILKNTYIWYPNKKNQIDIAEYLDVKTKKIDLLVERQTNAIELMKERKTALISSAVTGKIDVRDWQE